MKVREWIWSVYSIKLRQTDKNTEIGVNVLNEDDDKTRDQDEE